MKQNSTLIYVAEEPNSNDEEEGPRLYVLNEISVRSNAQILKILESIRVSPSEEMVEQIKHFAHDL